jgi:hypothetical protein
MIDETTVDVAAGTVYTFANAVVPATCPKILYVSAIIILSCYKLKKTFANPPLALFAAAYALFAAAYAALA